jgi:hypothetical protein
MPSLDFVVRLFRAGPKVTPPELNAYGERLAPMTGRLRGLYARWRETLEHLSREDELANTASIQRWEAAGLLDELRPIQPPEPLAQAQVELESIVADTARASQLLSNGYRFTSSRARCEGQALMLASEERFQRLCQALSEDGVNVLEGASLNDRRRAVESPARQPSSALSAVPGAGDGAPRSE